MIPSDKEEDVFILTKNIDGEMLFLENCIYRRGWQRCMFLFLSVNLINKLKPVVHQSISQDFTTSHAFFLLLGPNICSFLGQKCKKNQSSICYIKLTTENSRALLFALFKRVNGTFVGDGFDILAIIYTTRTVYVALIKQ